MNLRDLQYIVAVADHGHFGRAATACHVSQPTLSAQIKKLEDFLGVILFERSQRQVRLTDAGEQTVRRARHILQQRDELVASAQSWRNPLVGKLRVGAIPTIGPYLLPQVIAKTRGSLPDLSLEIFEDKTDPLIQRLVDGQIDLAVLALPCNAPGVLSKHLFNEPFLAAVPADHRFAGSNSVSLTSLREDNLLLLEDGHCLRDQALEICSRVNWGEHGEFRATSFETLRLMVAAGAGVTLLPAMAALTSRVDGIHYLEFEGEAPYRSVGMMWRQQSARHVAIEALGEVIQQSVDPDVCSTC